MKEDCYSSRMRGRQFGDQHKLTTARRDNRSRLQRRMAIANLRQARFHRPLCQASDAWWHWSSRQFVYLAVEQIRAEIRLTLYAVELCCERWLTSALVSVGGGFRVAGQGQIE